MNARILALWIEAASWGFVALGVVLPFAFATAVFAPYRGALAHWAFAAAAIPPGDGALADLMLGITGASIAGKWLVHACIARGPLAEGRAWARDLTLAGLAAWFAVDSVASLALGAAFNVWMINLAPLIVVGLPLLLFRGCFGAGSAPPFPPGRAARMAFATSLVGAASGLAIAFGGDTALFAPWFRGLAAAHYGAASVGEASRHHLLFALFFFGPVGGCTTAQFAMLAAWLRREGATARVVAAGAGSILAWFAIDSGYGLLHAGFFNIALVNLPAALLTLPPWLVLARGLRRGGD